MRNAITLFPLLFFLAAVSAAADLTDQLKSRIDQITGAKGAYTPGEDVYKVSFPRNDVKVSVDRGAMHPFMGLTSWAAFTSGHHHEAMVMGDLVLFEDEVNPVMSVALESGLEVTALHNHFFYDQPRVMFMHIGGAGSADVLAAGVRKALDRVKEIRAAAPIPAAQFAGAAVPAQSSITPAPIDAALGVKGQMNSGMYKAAIGRKASMHGREVGNQMGVNTWAAFAGADDNAFVDGDFAMLEPELQDVLKALRKAGINIVAIHNHMTHEEPQYVFLHYWGKGPAASLARGLRAALDAQSQVRRAEKVEPGALRSGFETINFDSATAGALPAGWLAKMTSSGSAPRWEAVAGSGAPSGPNVLAQLSSDATRARFPLAVLDRANLRNGEISVKFKPISGAVDQAAGLVWRYRDENNYYIVRANALENNVVLYKVEGGKRISLEPRGSAPKTYGVKHAVPARTWSILGVGFEGSLFTVYFDGRKLFEVEDSTFGDAGKVGLWTKADSVTYFDDFRILEK